MDKNYLEIIVHLINGENISYTTENHSGERNKLVSQYLDNNVQIIRLPYEYGATAYIDKTNILYIDIHDEIYSHEEITQAVEEYNNEHA